MPRAPLRCRLHISRRLAVWLLQLAAVLGPGMAQEGCKRRPAPGSLAFLVQQAERPEARAEACRAMGVLGNVEAVPPLLGYVREVGPWQPAAAQALGQLGASNETVSTTLAGLLQPGASAADAVGEAQITLNEALATALVQLRAVGAGEDLLRLLQASAPRSRAAGCRAAGGLRLQAAAPILVQLAQDHSQPEVVTAALGALGQLQAPVGVDIVVRSLYFPRFSDTAHAALLRMERTAEPRLLQTLRRANAAVEKQRDAQGRLLPEGVIEARAAAVLGATGSLAGGEEMGRALTRLQTTLRHRLGAGGEAPELVGACVQICASLGRLGSASVPALVAQLPGAKAPPRQAPALRAAAETVARAAAAALAQIGPDARSAAALLRATRHSSGVTQTAMARALSYIGDARMAAALRHAGPAAASLDAGSSERLAAADACGQNVACWQRALRDKSVGGRERAAWTLGWLQAGVALPDLLDVLPDAEPAVALGALRSVHQLLRSSHAELPPPQQASLTSTLQRLSRPEADKDDPLCQEAQALLARLTPS